jgi:hypothetical protein
MDLLIFVVFPVDSTVQEAGFRLPKTPSEATSVRLELD